MIRVETSASDFDAFEFQMDAEGSKTRRVEGRSWRFFYGFREGARKPGALEILRNYENQFKGHGGRVVYEYSEPVFGSSTMVMPLGGEERWLYLNVTEGGYEMHIIETAAMRQKLEFSADQMAQQLNSAGRLTLRGILFDTGKTDIKPESAALLDEVAGMLKANAGLKLRIDGHTDNAGAKSGNLQLSRGRAGAVKAALINRGIAATRLTSEGFGDTKPVADNANDAGRALNRRVELVKQ
jgi:adhesin HecA-like repeat protein